MFTSCNTCLFEYTPQLNQNVFCMFPTNIKCALYIGHSDVHLQNTITEI